MHIPTEICQTIIKAATCVPEAFNSSFDSYLHEDRESVVKAIQKSMSTKAALSLVSKLFHELAEEFLYEIIFVNRFDHIPHLAKLLQSQSGCHSSRGAYGLHCRRLEICLGTGTIDYKDQAWYEGGHVLWGLIPACPNVTILICHVWARRARAGLLRCPNVPHLTNPALWKIIASTCGPHLRRLELFGLSMRMDRVEMLMQYCTKLEVCHLVHIRPFTDGETYDGEEPTFQQPSGVRSSCVVQDEIRGEPSGFFDQETREGLAKTKNGVSWPPCSLGPPYSLPFLHTLHMDQFTPRIAQLDMSNLRALSIHPATSSREVITRDISSTNWSSATSLTHLSYCGYPIALQTFLDCFPNIKELSLHYKYEEDVQSVVTKPHHSLSVIKFCSVYYRHVNLSNHVADLLSVAQSKMLPSLTSVLITRGRIAKDDGGLPWGKFRTLGITLRVKVVKQSGRYKADGRIRMPDYTFRE